MSLNSNITILKLKKIVKPTTLQFNTKIHNNFKALN